MEEVPRPQQQSRRGRSRQLVVVEQTQELPSGHVRVSWEQSGAPDRGDVADAERASSHPNAIIYATRTAELRHSSAGAAAEPLVNSGHLLRRSQYEVGGLAAGFGGEWREEHRMREAAQHMRDTPVPVQPSPSPSAFDIGNSLSDVSSDNLDALTQDLLRL